MIMTLKGMLFNVKITYSFHLVIGGVIIVVFFSFGNKKVKRKKKMKRKFSPLIVLRPHRFTLPLPINHHSIVVAFSSLLYEYFHLYIFFNLCPFCCWLFAVLFTRKREKGWRRHREGRRMKKM